MNIKLVKIVLALDFILSVCSQSQSSELGKVYDKRLFSVFDINMVQKAIDEGSDLDALDKYSYTALIEAVICNRLKVAKLLIQAGANVNVRGIYGNTALKFAALFNNVEMAELLIQAGANPDIPNIRGVTPLMLAAENCNVQMCKLLIDSGADIYAKNHTGFTALTITTHVHPEIIKLIKCRMDKVGNIFDRRLFSLDVKEVQEAIAEGADINARNSKGRTALIVSACCIHLNSGIQTAKLLIDSGADLNIQDKDGYTALMFAVLRNNLGIVKLLIDKGADIDIKNKYGNTALMIAANFNFNSESFNLLCLIQRCWEEKEKAKKEVSSYLSNTDAQILPLAVSTIINEYL